MNFTRKLCVLIGLLAVELFPSICFSQTGPIKILVGYPPGATSDTIPRLLSDSISKKLGQPVVVENRPGAGGQLANIALKTAPADGTVLMFTPVATMAIFPHSFGAALKYDPLKDFAPVAHVSNFQIGLGVATNVPAKTLAEYVAWVKSNPEKNSFYGSAASGSIPHFFGVMFGNAAGLSLQHVPYRGTAPAMQALAGGEISALTTTTADIRTLVQAGKAKLLAMGGDKRSGQLPDIPTFIESGYNLTALPWYAMFAPAGTPAATIARISKAITDTVNEPSIRQRLIDLGVEPTGYGPERLGEILKADYERWGPAIKASGFKPE